MSTDTDFVPVAQRAVSTLKNSDFQKFLKLSKENINVLVNGQGKFKEYQDLKKVLETK